MKQRFDFVRSNRGAIVAEAAIVIPIVFIIVGAMFIVGLFHYQGAVVQSQAQKIANLSAKMIMQPGYENFGDISHRDAGFSYIQQNIDDAAIETNMYRYWGKTFTGKDTMEKELENLVKAATFVKLAKPNDIIIKYENFVVTQKIIVSVDMSINTPEFFKLINLPDTFNNKIVAVAIVSDPAEFVRNTDLAFDLAMQMVDFLGQNQTVQTMLQKLKDMKMRYL